MQTLKKAFIQLAIEHNVLQFGQFTLKSGRQSPYFFNAGLFYQGNALKKLGEFYAQKIADSGISFQHLFGPAYKGLPLATSTAIALTDLGIDTTVTFNRKEIKDHGEGGQLIGAPLHGETIIIDDVITAGTAFREAKQFINQHGGQVKAVVIAFDRCERGNLQQSTLAEIESENIQVLSIINLMDLIDFMEQQGHHNQVQQLRAYQTQYGIGTS